MTQYYIMCRSLTAAQRSARLLERSGITAVVVKAPQSLSSGGCAYAVLLRRRFDEAVALLKRNELLRGKLFSRSDSGEFTELQP